jgi:four helix bundle protein
MPHRDLNVLDAAEGAAVQVNELIDRSRWRLVVVQQLQRAAMSVPLNIGEGFGRDRGPDRNYKLVVARGEAEEAIKCLRANYRSSRIPEREYWPLHNRYVAIVKMLDSLLNS